MVRTTNNTVPASQTLDRGLAILETVASADEPLSVADIAERINVHRSIAYRLIRTLEGRNLLDRDLAGDYRAGSGLAILARSVRLDLRTAALPGLKLLADSLAMTAFLVVRDGDEAVTIESVEPTVGDVHLVYRPGTRHRISRGAPGMALLLNSTPIPRERAELRLARARGWASSASEVLPAMSSIAAPIGGHGALAVLWLTGQSIDQEAVGAAVLETAQKIVSILR